MVVIAIIGGLVAAYFLYAMWRVVYNMYFHPLAKFPGPWWAGATSYGEAYFDMVKGGRFFAEVEAMHARYGRYEGRRKSPLLTTVGPIVRVTPTELSIRDAEFYEHIYGGVIRRAPLLNFFSKQAVIRLEPFIWSRVTLLVDKLKHAQKTETVINAIDAYGALTTDVISYYAYGESFDYLGKDTNLEFKNDFLHAISGLCFVSPLMLHFPLIADTMKRLPDWFLQATSPGIMCINNLRRWCADNGKKALQEARPEAKDRAQGNTEKTLERMTDEGFIIIGAGLETTSRFLTNITCHLLLNPDIVSKLQAELKVAMPAPDACPPCSVLENLPYLSGVVNEGLRCETFLVTRFARTIVEPLPYKDFVIPAGTSIGCAPYLQNNNAEVFPEPEKFRPERWIEARERGENLTKYLGTFVKGGRMCIGINLAYTELYLTVAAIFRNFDMELVDSGLENILTYRGYTFGFTKNLDFGIKVKITKVLA
ncbi:hypothetical protein N0V90_004021 [Kalmusia sp. IMI 367209]|nr:hypothetical protein N0V90_004021 [Kalmusia sp. IMI 367209]